MHCSYAPTKQQSITEAGFNRRQVSQLQQLARNKDVVEQAKAEAKANDDIVSRSLVLF